MISSQKLGVLILMQHSAPDKIVIIINVPFRKYTYNFKNCARNREQGIHCWYIEPRNREKSLTLI